MLRGRSGPALPEEPRGAGEPREVRHTVTPHPAGAALGLLAVPVEGLDGHGRLVHLSTDGPGLLRPGDRSDPTGHPLHGVAQITVLLQGSLEHRDSLGGRGLLQAPAVHLVSGGAGVVSEIGESRDLRRDGGQVEMVRLRLLQPGTPVVPTTRVGQDLPVRAQGRSRVTRWVGVDGAVHDPGGAAVTHLQVAAGATLDLAVPDRHPALLLVRRGAALIGDDLTEVQGPATVVLTDHGTRLTIATRLTEDAGADVVLITTERLPEGMVHRDGLVAAMDEETLATTLEAARTPGFGSLPRLDG